MEQKTLLQNIVPKISGSIVLGFLTWLGTILIGLPSIFQFMFTFFMVMSVLFLILLDLPPLKPTVGFSTAANIILFFVGLAVLYYYFGAWHPQYNPKYEIEKIYRKPGVLTVASSKEDFINAGRVLFVDLECSNCHVAESQGGERGQNLDETDMGDDKKIEESILDPRKEILSEWDVPKKRDAMPDDYGDELKGMQLEAMIIYLKFIMEKSGIRVVSKETMPDGWWTNEKIFKRGEMIYGGLLNPAVNCSVCHGKDGTPIMTGAADMRKKEMVDKWVEAEWFLKIEKGVPHTAMPPWGTLLSTEDIWAVISYTHGLSREGKMEAPSK